jgi:hypothetical protein
MPYAIAVAHAHFHCPIGMHSGEQTHPLIVLSYVHLHVRKRKLHYGPVALRIPALQEPANLNIHLSTTTHVLKQRAQSVEAPSLSWSLLCSRHAQLGILAVRCVQTTVKYYYRNIRLPDTFSCSDLLVQLPIRAISNPISPTQLRHPPFPSCHPSHSANQLAALFRVLAPQNRRNLKFPKYLSPHSPPSSAFHGTTRVGAEASPPVGIRLLDPLRGYCGPSGLL